MNKNITSSSTELISVKIKIGFWKCISIVKIQGCVFYLDDCVEVINSGIEDLTGAETVKFRWNNNLFETYYNFFCRYFIWMN